jgi:hypothetical protein
LKTHPATVYWVSDRESLVHQVARTNPHGGTPYRRHASPDLWARFEWYEPLFKITATHVPRDTHMWQKRNDRIASECRTLMKDYYTTLQLEGFV